MDEQNERLGSLMAFSDIGLILSTYGVLLAFNSIVEPIGINTWIVCTFFLGIKILVVGIADITGIGKSAIISVIFIIIADAIIIFVNQLMAFGLSLRMLLIMVIADIVILAAAVLIWKRYAEKELPAEGSGAWIYDDTSGTAVVGSKEKPVKVDQEGLDQLFSDQTVDVDTNQEPVDVKEESIIDDSFFTESSEETAQERNYTFSDLSETIPSEPETPSQPAEFLSFEEITEEIPTEEIEEVLSEPEKTVEVEPVAEEPIVSEEVVEAVPAEEVEEPVVEEEPVEEIQEPVEEVQESVEVPLEETVEEYEPISTEPVITMVEPEEMVETEEAVETETESFSVLDLDMYKKITGRLPQLSTTFVPLSTNTSQIEIDQYRTEVRQQVLLLDDQLNCLINAFNRAPATSAEDRIEIKDRVSVNHSLTEGDQIIREKLKTMIDREFVSEDLLRSLIETTNAINNRSYSLDMAEANLRQRKEREAERRRQRRLEEEEKLRAAQEKRRKMQEEARLRQQREREREFGAETKEEKPEKKTIKTTPVLQNNEVHLQNDDLDIIINAEDLELLRSFLKQQDENK